MLSRCHPVWLHRLARRARDRPAEDWAYLALLALTAAYLLFSETFWNSLPF